MRNIALCAIYAQLLFLIKTSVMPEQKKKQRPRCYNCKFGGDQFRIAGMTHMHCENHDQYPEEKMKSGEISPWDTLMEFWQTCEHHQIKEPATKEVA